MLRIVTLMVTTAALLMACDMRPLNELTYAEKQEMIVKLTANCAAAGVTEKSPQYIACMQTEIDAENAKRARQSIGMTKFGDGMAAAGNSYSAAARANRPVSCTTNRAVGWGSTTTTCY